MRTAGSIVARVIFGVLAASVLVVATLTASASGSTTSATCTGKCFAVAVSPSNPAAGASTSFAFAITNEATTQTLGSAQISAPAGFGITGAPGSASFTSSSALFLNLNLAPSATTTLTVKAAAPCSGGTYQWGIEAKQANNFHGSGNDFQLDPASAGNLSGSATGSCSLAFPADGEPASTAAGAAITSVYNSQGPSVEVEVLDGSGQLDTGSTAAVTVAIGTNPGSGSLSGTVTVNASGGVASFSNLSIDRPGLGYTLTATSPGISPATSTSFNILGSIQPCSTSCSASSSTTTTSATVTTTSTIPAGDSLGFSLGGVSFSCNASYQQVSDAVSFDVFSPSGVPLASAQFNVSLETFKSAVDASGRTAASQWQICYASQQPFTAQPGTSGTAMIGGVSYHTGLLRDCTAEHGDGDGDGDDSGTQGAPCVQTRQTDNAGDVVIDFLATGDPVGWM